MAGRARRDPLTFGPGWLSAELARLLADFPQVRLCVAFSGGADSTALLAALAQLAAPPLRLRALHVDHGLQPDSRRWSAHCRRMARALGVPLTVLRARIERAPGASLEAAAREARYQLLGAALRANEVLLTAHHQDDQLETVLLQLLRGAGVAGLAAMPQRAAFAGGVLLRPLLGLPQRELLRWLQTQRRAFIEDSSNSDLQLDRNYLRARVLPLLRVRWPAAAASVARSARHAAEAQQLLAALGAADAARAACGAQLSARVLRCLPPARRRNALRSWITASGYRAPAAARLAEIAGPLLAARADAHPSVAWPGARVQRSGDLLLLGGPPLPAPPAAARQWHWQRVPALQLPQGVLQLQHDARGALDLGALPASVTVATRQGGERLRPRRGGPRRALKSLLQEARVPAAQRAQLPLLFAGTQLLAVADLWADESVQAHRGSRRRARLIWRPAV